MRKHSSADDLLKEPLDQFKNKEKSAEHEINGKEYYSDKGIDEKDAKIVKGFLINESRSDNSEDSLSNVNNTNDTTPDNVRLTNELNIQNH